MEGGSMSLERFERLEGKIKDIINFYETELKEVHDIIERFKKLDDFETNEDINLIIIKAYIKFSSQNEIYEFLKNNGYVCKYIDNKGIEKSRLYKKSEISNIIYDFQQNEKYPEDLRILVKYLYKYNSNGTAWGIDYKVPRPKILENKK